MACRAIITLFVFISVGCSHMLYYPTTFKYVDETSLKYRPTEVILNEDNKSEIIGWYFEAPLERRKNTTFIFFHGNGQNMSSHFQYLYWILDYGYSFLIFDYAGYGVSEGSPSPENTVDDGKRMINWIVANRPNDRLAIFAQSLGGNVALRSMSEASAVNYCLVVVESSFFSYKEVSSEILKKSWLTWLFQWVPYLVISDSKSISTNVNQLPDTDYIFIHGRNDNIVPYELGVDLYKKIIRKKQFWEVSSGGHLGAFVRRSDFRERLLLTTKQKCEY